jgi:prepilin-type N-terminal cleavage/methylation domain-containing protein
MKWHQNRSGTNYALDSWVWHNTRRESIRMNKKGFTLVEVVIAAAIMALTMMAFIGAFMQAKYSATMSDNRLNALQNARSVMEDLVSRTYGQIPLGTTVFSNGSYVVSQNPAYSNSIKDIAVTIRWVNPGTVTTSSLSLHGSVAYELHQPQ